MSSRKLDIIIPFSDSIAQLELTLDSLYSQKIYINKIIIVISGISKYSLFNLLNKKFFRLNELIFLTIDPSIRTTPATARNQGISISNSIYLAFLDCGIKAHPNWLNSYFSSSNIVDMRMGSTTYVPVDFQSVLVALLTYGTKPSYNSVPGSIIKKIICKNFQENMRYGEDIIWKRNYKKFLNHKLTYPCEYYFFPSNILKAISKYYLADMTSASNDKEIYKKLNIIALKIIFIYLIIIVCSYLFTSIIGFLMLSIYLILRLFGKNKLNYVFKKPAILALFLQIIIDFVKIFVAIKLNFIIYFKFLNLK